MLWASWGSGCSGSPASSRGAGGFPSLGGGQEEKEALLDGYIYRFLC